MGDGTYKMNGKEKFCNKHGSSEWVPERGYPPLGPKIEKSNLKNKKYTVYIWAAVVDLLLFMQY